MKKIKLLLVDDQNLVRMGICSLLQLTEHIQVVAQLSSGVEVLDAIEQYSPDIILLDIRMPQMNGLAVLQQMNDKNILVPTLILTTFDEHKLVLECLTLGALGYLRKDVSLESLIKAIETVTQGELWVQPALTEQVLENKNLPPLNNSPETFEQLTSKEVQVLRLVAAGYSNYEISQALHKSEGTIRNTVSFILAKLQVRDRTRAVLKAMELNLL